MEIRRIDQRTVEVSLPNKLGYERIAMECSASFARILGFVPERIEDLKTAVSEACINAMEHGNKWRSNTRVIVTMKSHDDAFSVSVKDEGAGMGEVPEEVEILKKIENLEPTRGLGLYLIRQLVDQVKFNEMTKEGHEVKMIIRLTS